MSLKVHECRISADECEKRAAVTSDPALKQSYASLAKEWRISRSNSNALKAKWKRSRLTKIQYETLPSDHNGVYF